MGVKQFVFGNLSDGTQVNAARIENPDGSGLTVIDYGATIQTLDIPDRNGSLVDVFLGYDTAQEYEKNDAYLGATIGRVGNRIGAAQFSLNGKIYTGAQNDGDNHLHGGIKGFDKCMWDMSVQDDRIICERTSPDGEEGYPGTLKVRVTFEFTKNCELHIIYDADTDQDTLVNMTNHSYFNLRGSGDVLSHDLTVYAERICEGDSGCLPTGNFICVKGTPFDFLTEHKIGERIGADNEQLKLAGGYDHNFCLMGSRAGVLYNEETGIEMAVDTDLPGMQVYSGNFVTKRAGKKGSTMDYRGAVCLETQLYPNAMNCYAFPSPVLRAGKHLHSETVYSFGIRK